MSGNTHRNGTAATFCVSWFVVAMSSTAPVAERPSQSARTERSPGNESMRVGCARTRYAYQAHTIVEAANTE